LVKATFYQNCLGVTKKTGLRFGIVSPSQEIIDRSIALGAEFTFIDEGTDLNVALSQAIIGLPPNQAILIIMPDLPFFSVECLQLLIKHTQTKELLIVPSISESDEKKGTAMLYMNRPGLLPFCFGLKSKDQFLQAARERKLKFEVIDIDPCARDLDTPDDIKYLRNHLSIVNGSKIYKKFLEKFFNEM
jgi:2-phospho-L-lactate guanylyltransferase (CobY/MobA/RfbA family)